MPVIQTTKEELQANQDFQSALKLVLPRLHGYLEANVLLVVARDMDREPQEKGIYLECYNDLLSAVDDLYAGTNIHKTEPTPKRNRLKNSQFQ